MSDALSDIVHVAGREILDSRGNPTVEVEVVLASGARGRAAVPSGACTGAHEAVELRDGGDRYGGKGVLTAVGHVNAEIAERARRLRRARPARHRRRAARPRRHRQQGAASAPTPSSACRSRWPRRPPTTLDLPLYRYVGGANAHVLPVPMMNVLNGGAHADNNVDFQEFMIVPVGAPSVQRGAALGHRDLPRAEEAAPRQAASRTARRRRGRLRARPRHQRGRASRCSSRRSSRPGYKPGEEIALALDPAVSELYRDGAYHLDGEGKVLTSEELVGLLDAHRRPLPDRLDRGRHAGGRLGRLEAAHRGRRRPRASSSATTCSSPTSQRLRTGIERGIANSILVKVNQIGTLTETLDTVALATQHCVHRGDVAPLAARPRTRPSPTSRSPPTAARSRPARPARSDRVAKYNQLLRIEDELGRGRRLPWPIGARAAPLTGTGIQRRARTARVPPPTSAKNARLDHDEREEHLDDRPTCGATARVRSRTLAPR